MRTKGGCAAFPLFPAPSGWAAQCNRWCRGGAPRRQPRGPGTATSACKDVASGGRTRRCDGGRGGETKSGCTLATVRVHLREVDIQRRRGDARVGERARRGSGVGARLPNISVGRTRLLDVELAHLLGLARLLAMGLRAAEKYRGLQRARPRG
ncbi:hypothetical protein DFH09DRAFT_1124193 [Mycena vulgaris]|nr:hypothetical protein DFH09DRAFT_1124193 [Mycena vulgaris]